MPIHNWTNWDQASANDNLFELLDIVERDREREALLKSHNELRVVRLRAKRLGVSRKQLTSRISSD